jgi:hypothetical protein
LQQVPIQFLADTSRRDKVIAKSQSLTEAIKKITDEVEKEMGLYMLPPIKPKTNKQMKKLFDLVSGAVILVLNCQLSSEELRFDMPKGRDKVDLEWMDCVGGFAEEKRATLEVLIPVSAAIMKVTPATRKSEVVAKAKIFPRFVRRKVGSEERADERSER